MGGKSRGSNLQDIFSLTVCQSSYPSRPCLHVAPVLLITYGLTYQNYGGFELAREVIPFPLSLFFFHNIFKSHMLWANYIMRQIFSPFSLNNNNNNNNNLSKVSSILFIGIIKKIYCLLAYNSLANLFSHLGLIF